MAENDARGDVGKARIVAGIDGVGTICGPVAGERRVEVELALIDELEDGVGEDRFGEGSGGEARAIRDGGAGCGVDGAEAAKPRGAAVLDERDRESGDVGLLHEAGDVVIEVGDGGPGTGLLRMDESGEGERGNDGSAKHAFSGTEGVFHTVAF